jgi:signal transduction histidine kinase
MHDMRSPLNVILAYTEIYQLLESTEAEKLEYIKNIETQTYRLNAFLTDMLMMTKMEAGQFILRYSTIGLDTLLDRVLKDYAIIAQSRGIQIVSDMPEHPLNIEVDVSLFQRVLDNLLSNAVKFSPPGATVTVQVIRQQQPLDSTQNDPASVAISISDEGPGVPQEYRERIFEKFEAAKLHRKGVMQIGLGLAFCKMVVDAHSGTISVQDNVPTGSIFTVEI